MKVVTYVEIEKRYASNQATNTDRLAEGCSRNQTFDRSLDYTVLQACSTASDQLANKLTNWQDTERFHCLGSTETKSFEDVDINTR